VREDVPEDLERLPCGLGAGVRCEQGAGERLDVARADADRQLAADAVARWRVQNPS
jgi:hypothetical protein